MSTPPASRQAPGPGLLALFLLPVLACAPQRRPPADPVPATAEYALVLAVENECEHDVQIYIVRAASRIPLGTLASAEQRVFQIEAAVLGADGELRLLAEPVDGAPPIASNAVKVRGGQIAEWRINHPPLVSPVSVW